MKKVLINKDGVQEVDITAEEIAVREQDAIDHNAKVQAKTDYENLKASAKAKLIAGEALTEDEANTIVL